MLAFWQIVLNKYIHCEDIGCTLFMDILQTFVVWFLYTFCGHFVVILYFCFFILVCFSCSFTEEISTFCSDFVRYSLYIWRTLHALLINIIYISLTFYAVKWLDWRWPNKPQNDLEWRYVQELVSNYALFFTLTKFTQSGHTAHSSSKAVEVVLSCIVRYYSTATYMTKATDTQVKSLFV